MDYSKLNGLIPAVIQDDESGEVLMVGFMNDEALSETRATGIRHVFLAHAAGAVAEGRDVGQPAGGGLDRGRLRRGHAP